jgi:hypothetical protein
VELARIASDSKTEFKKGEDPTMPAAEDTQVHVLVSSQGDGLKPSLV